MNFYEILGYAASALVAVSLLMSSIVKLRWINMAGALLFTIYGFLIHALPVAFMNLFIVGINAYYLAQIYRSKEVFKLLPVLARDSYIREFLKFHDSDIQQHFPSFEMPEKPDYCYLILRNMQVAGVFVAHHSNNDRLEVVLDFVVAQYRDFKLGKYIYDRNRNLFADKGFTEVYITQSGDIHHKYLTQMGFVKQSDGSYCKAL